MNCQNHVVVDEKVFIKEKKCVRKDQDEKKVEVVEEEIKPKYTEKISGDELEKMRMARLSRFG